MAEHSTDPLAGRDPSEAQVKSAVATEINATVTQE